jgi:hypothetical protein
MDYDVVIAKANQIVALAQNAKILNEVKEAIDSTEGGDITPYNTSGKPLDYAFFDDSADLQAIIAGQVTVLNGEVTAIETLIDGLADDIKAEV